MGVVEDFNRVLGKLKASINKGIQTSIQKNEQVLITQQTEGQFDKGQDSNGMQFVPSYAMSTKVIKKSKGQPTDRVTLKDTGDLYSNITITANTTNAMIEANTEYFKYLVTHYSNNSILGIQADAMEEFLLEFTLPEIENNFNQILG
jgi:hypothetical protein